MGAGFHGGFGGGTQGAKDNATADLIAGLEKSGVKFTKENIVFITKDGTEQTVWLETGSQSTGMQHIISRHADDFQTKHGIAKTEIASHLETVFRQGKVEYSRVKPENGGYERLYSHNGKYYLLSGVGTNGYIVSAYPIGEKEALTLIGRYGK